MAKRCGLRRARQVPDSRSPQTTHHSTKFGDSFRPLEMQSKSPRNGVAFQIGRQMAGSRRATEDFEGCPWRFGSSGSKMVLVFGQNTSRWHGGCATTVEGKSTVVRRRDSGVHRVEGASDALDIVVHSSEGSKRSMQVALVPSRCSIRTHYCIIRPALCVAGNRTIVIISGLLRIWTRLWQCPTCHASGMAFATRCIDSPYLSCSTHPLPALLRSASSLLHPQMPPSLAKNPQQAVSLAPNHK